jgi:hypothetical protein
MMLEYFSQPSHAESSQYQPHPKEVKENPTVILGFERWVLMSLSV